MILDELNPIIGLADSKKLTAARREKLYDEIRAKALCCSIAEASVQEIDTLNILQATLLAMQRAVAALSVRPSLVLVDGNRAPELPMPARAIVGGDALEPAISAASIVAKVYRDRLMVELGARHPGYGFERHFGYGTIAHRQALVMLGPCRAHRHSFAPVRLALQGRFPTQQDQP